MNRLSIDPQIKNSHRIKRISRSKFPAELSRMFVRTVCVCFCPSILFSLPGEHAENSQERINIFNPNLLRIFLHSPPPCHLTFFLFTPSTSLTTPPPPWLPPPSGLSKRLQSWGFYTIPWQISSLHISVNHLKLFYLKSLFIWNPTP